MPSPATILPQPTSVISFPIHLSSNGSTLLWCDDIALGMTLLICLNGQCSIMSGLNAPTMFWWAPNIHPALYFTFLSRVHYHIYIQTFI